MKFSTEISEELSGISALLAGMEKRNVFSIPEGYFDELTVNTIKNISLQKDLSKLHRQAIPNGYFENLSNEILTKIKDIEIESADELRALSPMLYSVQNENVFKVPQGYFKNLPENIVEKITAPTQAKIVEFKKKISVWRYAAAAVLAGVIATSSLMIFNPSQSSYNSQATVAASIVEASHFKNEQQILSEVASLSKDDIIKYLEKTGNDADNESLTINIDEKGLPEQKDYLLNGQTLETYLNNIDKEAKN